jgi:signal transduction histidine kinase
MRIATRLKLSSYLSLSVLIIMIPALFWSFGDSRKAKADELLAGKIIVNLFEREFLRDEYLLHREERARTQWNARKEIIDRLLRQAEAQFTDKSSKDLLGDMRRINADVVVIFGRYANNLVALRGPGNSTEFEKRLTSQNILKASALHVEASRMQESAMDRVKLANNRSIKLVIIFIVVVVVTTVLNSALVNRILRKRLAAIQAGARIIGGGNLEYRIVCQGSDELVDLAETLNSMTDNVQQFTRQLEAANRELEAFSYSVSHDLRAPLRHINGFIEMLGKQDTSSLNEKSLHYLQVIAESAKKMGTLIDDLLAFSRMGRAEMLKTRVSLAKLVSEAQQELQSELAGKDINWEADSLPEVYGDPAMLRLVLVNLIGNAVKFSSGRETIRISISCSQCDNPDETICRISDNGVGFDMKYVDKLYGLFQRLHSPEEFEGTGVGLANVRRIIQRHGGRTWAEGEVNGGAAFYFSLPNPDKRDKCVNEVISYPEK